VRVLVTGATGFIGRRMMRHLLGRFDPADVTCLIRVADRKPEEREAAAAYRALGVHIVEGDLVRQGVADQAPPAVDLVIHLAAETSTLLSEPELVANDRGTDHLVSWLLAASTGWRLAYASSSGAVDRSGPASGPLDEQSPCTPRTPYGLTKLRGEQVLQRRAGPDTFSYTILRFPTVYGPGQMEGGLFDRMLEMTARRSLLSRIDWPGRSSVIYVDDLVKMMYSLACLPEAANEVYLVASDEVKRVTDIAQAVGRHTGHPVDVIRLPRWAWTLGRWVAWNRPIGAAMSLFPRKYWIPYWRLGLLIDDGFWYDTSKLRRVYREPLSDVAEGLERRLRALAEPPLAACGTSAGAGSAPRPHPTA
jgi:dihydroflavonol-4-reductase